jgi:FkbM family methyltransferase
MTDFDKIARYCQIIPAGVRGKTRTAKALLGSRLDARDVVLKDRFSNRFLVPSLREPIAYHLLIDGVYDEEVLEFILSSLSTSSTFVDVGANIGAYSIPAARNMGVSGKVLAIEASPKVFPYLKRNVQLNQSNNVRCFNVAAGHKKGEMPFYEAPVEKFGMGSLAAQFDGNSVTIPVRTLDQIVAEEKIAQVDLLKIDVEGFEARVLQGAQVLLQSRKMPLIIFEFCDWAEARMPDGKVGDAQQFLLDAGFSIWRLEDFTRGRPPVHEPIRTGYAALVARRQKR